MVCSGMLIAVASDLHINYADRPIEWPDADVLVIAGDTANDIDDALPLYREVAKRYRHVVTVDGNHEHWLNRQKNITVEENIEALLTQLPDNVYLLGQHLPSIEIDGVIFIGANGWYTGDAVSDPSYNREWWKTNYSDAYHTGFLTIPQAYPFTRAHADAELVSQELAKITDSSKPVFVITHTVPHRSLMRSGPQWDYMNNFFWNSGMQRIIENNAQFITGWIFGHTHDRMEKVIGSTLFLSNPRGSIEENPRWWVVTLPVIDPLM